MQNLTRLQRLENNRSKYINVCWLSSSGIETKITDLDDSYLLNVMKSVSRSLQVSKDFPAVEEFQSYNNTKYTDWAKFLQNEYLYRQEVVEEKYLEHLDLEMQVQLAKEANYYDDKYDCPSVGNLY